MMSRDQILLLVSLSWLCLGKAVLISSSGNPNSFSSIQNNASGLLDLRMKTDDIIRKYGYPVETHTVTTDDGYLLTVHRIPGSPKAPSSGVKTPVLLMHALMMASDVWVATGPERGLGFILADLGYDVWMGNSRGNLYSRKHKSLSPNNRKFWDFSWHEMGVYDLPAIVDHVLKTTNQEKLFYVGYSMGNTMFFVLNSMKPEYNQKFRLMTALAPVAYDGPRMSVLQSVFRLVSYTSMTEIFPRTNAINSLITYACQNAGLLMQGICSFVYFQIMGFNTKELDMALLPLYISRTSSGTSRTTFEHYSQIFTTDRFQMLDRNARRRGHIAHTPEYNLTLVTAPVALIYAPNDAVIRPEGVQRLSKELPNVVRLIRVADEEASHGDFTFAKHVKRLVYDDVISLLHLLVFTFHIFIFSI